MRIGIVSPTFPPDGGGVSFYVYNLAKELVKKGHKIIVFTRGHTKYSDIQEIEGIYVNKVPFLPVYPFHVNIHGIFINRIFKTYEKQLDILHTHIPLPPIVNTKLPILATVHGLPELKTRILPPSNPIILSEILFSFVVYNTEEKILRKANKVTTVSHSTGREIEYYYNLSNKDITVIGNGVDETFFSPKHNENNEINVLYAGRLDQKKGLLELVQSAREICSTYENVNFKIAGDGPFLSKLLNYINKNDLSERVLLYGHVDRNALRRLYQNSSIFLLPSYYEGLPNVILEAMSCGLPIIATDVGGISEVVHEGDNGFLIQPQDHNQITNSLKTMIDNKSLREKMGKKSRSNIIKYNTWNEVSNRYIRLYEELLK